MYFTHKSRLYLSKVSHLVIYLLEQCPCPARHLCNQDDFRMRRVNVLEDEPPQSVGERGEGFFKLWEDCRIVVSNFNPGV